MTSPIGGAGSGGDGLPVISVVVPCRNGEETLGEQLGALAAQMPRDGCEIIVIDDGSTDRTADVIRAWQEQLGHLRTVTLNGNGGSASAARNAGLRAARGERVLFCDADDVVEPGWIAALAGSLETHDIVGGPLAFDALNPGWPSAARRQLDQALPVSVNYLPFAHTGNLGVRRAQALAIGGFDESMTTAEDQDFSWRAAKSGLSIGFARDAVVQVRLPVGLRSLWRQRVSWGAGSVDLYVRHRSHMQTVSRMPPWRRLLALERGIVSMVVTAVRAVVSRPARIYLVESVAVRVGRLRGSLANRTLYL